MSLAVLALVALPLITAVAIRVVLVIQQANDRADEAWRLLAEAERRAFIEREERNS